MTVRAPSGVPGRWGVKQDGAVTHPVPLLTTPTLRSPGAAPRSPGSHTHSVPFLEGQPTPQVEESLC